MPYSTDPDEELEETGAHEWRLREAEPAHIGDGECIAETPKAILVKLGKLNQRWIPKSCLHDDSEVFEKGGKGHVIVKFWWADKEKL